MEWLMITTSTALYRFRTDEIVCVRASGNYCDVCMCTGTPSTLTFKLHQFDEWFATLRNNTFVRVGRSIIVNKLFVQSVNITDCRIVLSGGKMPAPVTYTGLSKDSLKALKTELEKGEQS